MMLGLKRDLRKEGEGIIYPQEVRAENLQNLETPTDSPTQTYRIAQELHCDRYAECSAVTGELLAETFEDLARLAGMSITAQGAQSEGGCTIL